MQKVRQGKEIGPFCDDTISVSATQNVYIMRQDALTEGATEGANAMDQILF